MNATLRPYTDHCAVKIASLPPLQQAAIHILRQFAGEDGIDRAIPDRLWSLMGPGRGARIAHLWADLLSLFDRFAHRPLQIRPLDDPIADSDEAGFAAMIALGAEGERENVMFMVLMMVRADVSPIVTSLAIQIGLSLRQGLLAEDGSAARATHHFANRLH
ncbi:hypothetical protein [Yoonia sp.]|uniref:hypothetical protein n=1 Tax=Yoonia sp. TaxID=2212373 RepID=UPI002FD910E3